MGIIAKPLGMLLTFIYSLVGSYGWSLIILTVIVRCCLYPLYVKQMKSTAGMADLQPKMQAIQKKYANDQEKMSEEMQKLYKEGNFNPMGGCLPMLISMVIIMGLFSLLRNPMRYMNDSMLIASHESFFWIKDLAQPDLWVLPILAAIGTYLAYTMTSMLTSGDPNQAQSQSMMKVMKYVFPLSILWLARAYPAGLAIYWAGGQFLQVFFNMRMNKVRRQMQEESERKKLIEKAERQIEKKKRARMKGYVR